MTEKKTLVFLLYQEIKKLSKSQLTHRQLLIIRKENRENSKWITTRTLWPSIQEPARWTGESKWMWIRHMLDADKKLLEYYKIMSLWGMNIWAKSESPSMASSSLWLIYDPLTSILALQSRKHENGKGRMLTRCLEKVTKPAQSVCDSRTIFASKNSDLFGSASTIAS